MSERYCITMELVRRKEYDIQAVSDEEAVSKAENVYKALPDDGSSLDDGDLETSFAVSEADGRDVLPWTDPVSVEWPEGPERVPPSRNDPEPEPGGDYAMTVEHKTLAAEWFDAPDDAAAERKAREIMDRYNADPHAFEGGATETDFALSARDGRDIIPWS